MSSGVMEPRSLCPNCAIKVYEPIPPAPPYGFVSYIWQFEGGCAATPPPGELNRDSISVVWQDWGNGMEWRAYWYVITDCDERTIERGDRIFSFEFTDDGVKVRVGLDDLMTATDETGTLIWHAAVRRVPFIYYIDGIKIERTTGADYTPDVVKFDGTTPEEFATWEPR